MDLAKKRDEFDSTFMCIPCDRGAGLSGCSTGAHCLAFLWQIRFSFQSFSFQKGAKETGFNFKDFSALTELADNPENKGSGDTVGLGVTALCCPHSV